MVLPGRAAGLPVWYGLPTPLMAGSPVESRDGRQERGRAVTDVVVGSPFRGWRASWAGSVRSCRATGSGTSRPRPGPGHPPVGTCTTRRCHGPCPRAPGSLDSLQESTACGLSPSARQTRDTWVWLSPWSAAIDRVDQCASPPGGTPSRVLLISASTCWSDNVLAAPAAARPPDRPAGRPGTGRAAWRPSAHSPRACVTLAPPKGRPRTPGRSSSAAPTAPTTPDPEPTRPAPSAHDQTGQEASQQVPRYPDPTQTNNELTTRDVRRGDIDPRRLIGCPSAHRASHGSSSCPSLRSIATPACSGRSRRLARSARWSP